jgi:hypothetical protein
MNGRESTTANHTVGADARVVLLSCRWGLLPHVRRPLNTRRLFPALRLVRLLDPDIDFGTLVAGSDPDSGDGHADTHP